MSQELRLTQYELPMGGTLGDQRLQSRGLEVWPEAWVAPGVPPSEPVTQRVDSLIPRGGETGRAEELPGTDAVHGSGGQDPVPGAPLDGCKTSWSVSQRPGSLSSFVNPDRKSCRRCNGYDSRFCGQGAQPGSAHTGDGEQPAPVAVTHTAPWTAGMAP